LLGFFSKKADKSSGEAFEFTFDLPPYRQQESKLPEVVNVWLQLDGLSGEAVHLLVELNHFLHELNRTFVNIAKRYSITERCLDYAAPAIRAIYFEHQKGKALPENHIKREALTAAIKCVKELSYSFKRIIKNDFTLSGKELKNARRRLAQSLFSAFEMIHAEQRLKALRYQKLGKLAWRDCNNLFVVLQSTDDGRQKFKPALYLTIARTLPTESGMKSLKASAEEIYILIQLFGFIDPNSMSLQQAVIVENYLKQLLPELSVEAFDVEQLPLQCVVTTYGQERPPSLNEKNEQRDRTLAIDIKPLVSRLRHDYTRLLPQLNGAQNDFEHEQQPGAEAVPAKAVNSPEDIERLLALRNMLKKTREAQRADTRKYSNDPVRLYLYNGFTAGFRMLNANKLRFADQGRLLNQLNISLAQRSALLADDEQQDNLTHWEVINESAGGLLLRTKETQYIKNLFIGQLIVFAKSKDDLSNPACGWVVRICRDSQANVEISLKILALQVESAIVQTEFLRKNAMGMPGIMVLDAGEDLQLLMHQSHRLPPGTQLNIQRDGMGYVCTVGDMAFFQREFVAYWLRKAAC
jgi:hypothetical protein